MNLLSLFNNTNPNNLNTIILGEDQFLNSYLIDSYIKQDDFSDFDKVSIDCETDGLDELIATMTEASLFSNQKVIRIKNPFFLLSKSVKKYQKQIKQLEELFAHLTELEDILIIDAPYEKIDRRKKISKIVVKNFNVVNPIIKPYEIASVTKAIIKAEGYSISQSALQLLIERSDQVMDTILSNFNKLKISAIDHKITEQLVDQQVDISLAQNVFAILDAAFSGRFKEAIKRLDQQLREGSNPIQLLAVFENQIETLCVIKMLARRGRNENQIVKELGLHPYRVKLALQSKISLEKLKHLLAESILFEYNYKKGNYHDDNFLKMFILNV